MVREIEGNEQGIGRIFSHHHVNESSVKEESLPIEMWGKCLCVRVRGEKFSVF